MLYTTKQIAEMYGGDLQNVTPYMITHTWIPNGLKHIKGKGQSFLYKKEWIEEYLDSQTIINFKENKQRRIVDRRRLKANNNCFVV